MATKQELESTIERLRAVIAKQERALKRISDAGMEVIIPTEGWEHDQAMSHAPYLGVRGKNGKDPWQHRVMAVVFKAIRENGIKRGDGICGATYLRIIEGGTAGGECYIIPEIAGKFVIELINACADFGCECFQAGIAEGSNVLKQLAHGEVTPQDYEDRLAREMARKTQNDYKRYTARKY